MDIDQEKIEETVSALLYLTSFGDKSGLRVWKGQDWGVMNSLHEKAYISNPATKAKSIVFTEDGAKAVERAVRAALCGEVSRSSLACR